MRSLERSCTQQRANWVRVGSGRPGIERIEAFFCGHAYDTHRHDTYALGYTLSGVQTFDYRGSRAVSTPGNVMIIAPDEPHNGCAGTDEGFLYRMIYLEPRFILDALGAGRQSLPLTHSAIHAAPGLYAALVAALGELDAPLEDLRIDQIVLMLTDSLVSLDPSLLPRSRRSVCKVAVGRARELLDAHSADIVTSEALENATGLDRYSLARHFRALCGISPYRYLVARRLERARIMIASGHELIDVAAQCGFSDQSHMTRQFKSAFGVTPGQWRVLATNTSGPRATGRV
ncbi:helix-turn-helix domain-containing protein [Paraburkholderia jirisanensis]